MRILLPLLLLAGCSAARADRPPETPTPDPALAARLVGLTAGRPMRCIGARFATRSITAVGPALVYEITPGLIYVNHTSGGCERVGRGDILVTRSLGSGSGPCEGDQAITRASAVAVPTGSCTLGPFVPYRKADR